MNEIVITWAALLPEMFFSRLVVIAIGVGMFAHFMCMANAAPPRAPWHIVAFLVTLVALPAAMVFCAISGPVSTMWGLLAACAGTMLLFYLWLWWRGMHVQAFLRARYDLQ